MRGHVAKLGCVAESRSTLNGLMRAPTRDQRVRRPEYRTGALAPLGDVLESVEGAWQNMRSGQVQST
jgi:hypothetical protein